MTLQATPSATLSFAALSLGAVMSFGLPANADAEGQVDVLVVPFSSSGVAADESAALATATVGVFAELGRGAELAGVGTAEILTLSGCEASDAECLATIPETLDTKTVVFGTGRVNEGVATVVLIVVDSDAGKRRHSVVLIGTTREARLARYSLDLKKALTPECIGPECPDDETETSLKLTNDPAAGSSIDEPIEPMTTASASQAGSRWDASRVGETPWIVGGAGLGAVALGAGFLVWGGSKQSQVDDASTDSVEDLERLEDLEGQAKTLFTVGNVLVVGGLAATLVAGGLAFHHGRQGPDDDSSVSVGPMLLPSGGGVMVSIEGWQ